ncbi:extracellular solute-binding protein [Streptomyces alboflavus]|uniref:extracellular solute-binding protein n=1 Tax=Streptomyces alboflavus TaxID=67267 RepID=UPI00369A666C
MRRLRAAAAVAALTALTATACGGGTATGGGSNDSPKTLTYWASNQGPNIEADKKILTPRLEKFEKQTGIKVKLEVIPWSDLLNRILTATTSGQGPDVLNIGNTWSSSLQASGALLPWDAKRFGQIGGKDRFVSAALGSTGARGKDPAAVPLYSLAYALYYNKKMFKDAGIERPPATWEQLVADGKKLSKGGTWALGAEGSNLVNNIHQVHVLGKQHGAVKFVKFMTSDAEQTGLNKAYGSIPPVKAAQSDPAFARPETAVLRDTLAESAAPLPQVPHESQFETTVGTAVKELFADAAEGRPVTTGSVKSALTKAQQQMPKG